MQTNHHHLSHVLMDLAKFNINSKQIHLVLHVNNLNVFLATPIIRSVQNANMVFNFWINNVLLVQWLIVQYAGLRTIVIYVILGFINLIIKHVSLAL